MSNLLIDNRDTLATIDTYQMFTGESAVEVQLENLHEDYGEDVTYDDFDWSYDHKAIVTALAEVSLAYTLGMVREYLDCKDVTATVIEAASPRFYNYTTDWYVYTPILPDGLLAKYYADNIEACNTRLAGYSVNSQKENWQHATWCEIVDRAITVEDTLEGNYNMHMWEKETDVYYENTTVTPVTKS